MKYNSKQLECIKHPLSPLMILAGAGTGKTTTIIARISDYIKSRDINPKSILVLTYTVNSANQLKYKLSKIIGEKSEDIMAMNFHSFGNLILSRYYTELGYDKVPTLLNVEEIYSLIKQIIVSQSEHLMSIKLRKEPFSQIKNLKSIFDRFRDELLDDDFLKNKLNELKAISTDDPDEQEKNYQYIDNINLYTAYQNLKMSNSWIDYGDMIVSSWKAVKNNKILSDFQNDIKHVIVDEFQDNNYAINEIVRHIISKTKSITVVGDDDQSIYSFRGANLSAIEYFRIHYGNVDSYKEIILDVNYRSVQNILDLAHQSIDYNKNRIKENSLKSNSTDLGEIKLLTGERDKQTLDIREKIISSLKRGKNINQIAILTRTQASAKYFSDIFNVCSIENNYKSAKLFENSFIKDVLSVMNVFSQNENIDISLYRLLRYKFKEQECAIWFHGMKKKYTSLTNLKLSDIRNNKIDDFIKSMINKLATNDLYVFFHKTVSFCADNLKRDKNLHHFEISHLEKMILRYQSNNNNPSINELIKYLNLSSEINETYIEDVKSRNNQGLHIATVHQSKGLEFEDVYIPFIESSQFPVSYKKDRELYDIPVGWRDGYTAMKKGLHIEEERRIFHVAITRAKNNLYMYSGNKRQSIFIKELIEKKYQSIEIDNQDILESNNNIRYENIPLYTEKIKFSATSMETYEKCPLSYKLRYFCGLGEYKSTSHLHLGLVVHKVLESATKNMNLDYDNITALVNQKWDSDCFETIAQSDEYKKDAILMIFEYMKIYDTSEILDVFYEKKLEIEDSSAIYTGKCDRIDVYGNKKVKIVDYKTSKSKISEKALIENFQLNYYSLLLSEIMIDDLANLEPSLISLIFLRYENPEICTEIFDENLLEMSARRANIVDDVKKGKFNPQKGPHCNYCEFKDLLCPLYS